MRVLVSWLFILTWIEQVGLRIGYARPCARGWNRRRYGPCAAEQYTSQLAAKKIAAKGGTRLVCVSLGNEELRLLHAVRVLGVGRARQDGVLDLRAERCGVSKGRGSSGVAAGIGL